jgi:hypothetical protein
VTDRRVAVYGHPARLALLISCVAFCGGIAICGEASASAPPPVLSVSPSSGLLDGKTVSVSVGPNGFFTPGAHVNILECADKGGTPANLPKDDSTCDGNTIQGPTVLVAANGSFSDAAYTVYELPSPALGEQHNTQPICNTTNQCVLFVGQNQNDFSAPKVFSAPFSIGAGVTTSTTNPATSTGSSTSSSGNNPTAASSTTLPASGSSGGTDPSVTLSSAAAGGTLAKTGAPADLIWMVALGAILVIGGSFGRRLAQRRAE